MKLATTLSVLFVLLFTLSAGIAQMLPEETVAPKKRPAGVSASDWAGILKAYESQRHRFLPMEDGTHGARNPGQCWSIRFDRRGFEVHPDGGGWSWGLEMENAESGSGLVEGERLYFERGQGVREWFANDERGLEQGWILSRPTGPLRLRIRGGLEAAVEENRVQFDGRLTYAALKAWDAEGRTVHAWFEATDDGFAVHHAGADAVYPVTIDPIARNTYLKASNTDADDFFGSSVAIDGDRVVVGASGEDSNSNWIDGAQENNGAFFAGAAYVFVRDSEGVWRQEAYLKADDTRAYDVFGASVAIHGDRVAVGASSKVNRLTAEEAGAAYIFARQADGNWSQEAFLTASNPGRYDYFGESISLDGDFLVVGAPGEDSAAIGINGNGANGGAANSGAAYIFARDNAGSWNQEAYLKASNTGEGDFFGISVTIDGDRVVVGALDEDSAATGVNGNQSDNNADSSGAVYVFLRENEGTWTQEAYLKASNSGVDDRFGLSVALNGERLVVGAPGEASAARGIDGNQADNSADHAGAAYVFVRDLGEIWRQEAYLKASNAEAVDQFGTSVALDGDRVVVGALGEASAATGINGDQARNGAIQAGAVYLFVREFNGVWRHHLYMKASNANAGDQFNVLAMDGDLVVVGAPGEDSAARSIGGTEVDNGAVDSGAAYVFSLTPLPAFLTLESELSFPRTAEGRRSRPQYVLLRNIGGTPSTLLNYRLVGRNRNDFEIVGGKSSLAPGETIRLRATFAPTKAGRRSAKLLVRGVGGSAKSNFRGNAYASPDVPADSGNPKPPRNTNF